ncbi:MAG: type IV toxin-antitoxin system AbiEi family antitoxin domain-containing protein [Xanthomonadales bacterium]|nr:type IV toxin-antitoxin system AbiEi family antitoxin domain-containing protein [Xanthomonadales bacterium]
MSEQKYKKINQLAKDLPEGLLADAKWMEQHGYYGSLRTKYLAAGWLERPTRGVYRRPRGDLTWEQAVISLQSLMHHPVTVGGRTALELQGFAHYLSHAQQEVFLYGDKPLPGWTANLPIETRLVFRSRRRLFPGLDQALPTVPLDGQKLPDTDKTLSGAFRVFPWGHWKWPLVVSTAERAVFELLDELPDRESFHQVDGLMEGLATLSPRRLQELLVQCRSIKVKRLFLFFADRHNHAWLQRINHEDIDLGKGKRMLVKGGKFDPTYQITVPEDLHGVQ